jgi:hypothetical protein
MTDTATQASSIFDQLQQIEALDLDAITFQGTNVRLIAGQRTTFPIEDRTGYVKIPANTDTHGMRLTRLDISDQSGKLVIRGEMILMGETIGLLGDEDSETPLPIYVHPHLAMWRTYGHAVRFEFQNPRPETVQALLEQCQAKGFVPYEPQQREDQEPYERAAGVQVLHSLTSANGNSSKRFAAGIPVASCVIVPDQRIGPSLTEYLNSDKMMVQRPAFTSFIDSLIPLMGAAIAAGAGEDNRAKQSALNRLSTLTGYNAENGWSHRPSLGYVTFEGGEELTVFPDRTMPTDGQTAAEAAVDANEAQSAEGTDPTAVATQAPAEVKKADKPFES